jgi:CRP-like cAMP-binding protein
LQKRKNAQRLSEMMHKDIIKIFRQTELFADLSRPYLQRLAEHAVEIDLPREGLLFVAGEEAKGLFVLAQGSVRGFRTGIDGREQVIYLERAPATLGEIPVFDQGSHFATVCAAEVTKLYFIKRNHLRALCLEQPEFALRALKIVAAKARKFVLLVDELSLQSVRARLVNFILSEARKASVNGQGEIHLKLNLTRGRIAAHIGTVREVVSRNLKQMESEGFIRLEKDTLIIPDEKALIRYATKGKI